MILFDAHNHLQDPRFGSDLPAVIAEMKTAGIRHAIVNGTSEADWPQVLALHHADPDFISPALGLHPWRIASRSAKWETRLRELLEATPASSIGECGLDLWMPDADLAQQREVLAVHFSLSREFDKPLTLHCLKAWNPLLQALKQSPSLPPFLLHSFGGPAEMIPSLVKLGAHFSLSGHFLHPRKARALDAFRHIPLDRIHVESDAPDMAPPLEYQGAYHRDGYHHPADIIGCLEALAHMHRLPPEDCALAISKNTARLFSHSLR
jgi:TatD DNase family protein